MAAIHEGLSHYARLFGLRPDSSGGARTSGELDRESLPSPVAYLATHGLLRERVRGEWAQVICPVHKGGEEKTPSMGVSLVDGHFRCHACGAKGGDVIALHRLRTGLGFRDAVFDLGGRFHD